MKKTICALLTFSMVIGLMAGCSGGGEKNPSDPVTKESQQPVQSAAAAGGEILIGSIQDISGSASVLGTASVYGAELAVKHVNEAGGVNGKMLKLSNYDTRNDSNEAINAYTRLAQVDGAVAVLGPPVANIALAVQSATNSVKVPIVGSFADPRSSMGEDLNTLYPYMFVMQATSDMFGQREAEYVYQNFGGENAKIGILLCQDHSFNVSQCEAFMARAKELGMEIVDIEYNMQADTDYKTQLINIMNSGATVFYNGNPVTPLVISQTQAYQLGLRVPTVGSNDFSNPFNTLVADKEIADNIFLATNVDFDDPALADIRKEYVETYGAEPTRFSYLGYDQVMLVVEAIRQAGSDDPEAVRDALENKIVDMQLCSGVFSFDPETHWPLGLGLVFYKLEDGEYVLQGRFGGLE